MHKNVLDLETSSISGNLADGYALEPWRVRQGKAFISSLHYLSGDGQRKVLIERPSRQQLIDFLETLAGQEVWCWNTTFDAAFLIASIEPEKLKTIPQCITNIRWRDGLLLAKWIINGQAADRTFYSFSLANVCSDALRDEPGVEEFVRFKHGAPISSDSAYWNDRGILDCIWTQRLVDKIWTRLLPTQHVGFTIESACIPYIANSWLIGLHTNRKKLNQLEAGIAEENRRIQALVDFDISVVASPTKMKALLFGKLGFKPQKQTASGADSTDIETLKLILYELKMRNDPQAQLMEHIMQLKQNSTVQSKYVKTAHLALSRTNEDCMYPIPKMFGTNSGRFTYSNETYKGNDGKVSIAAHQMPRRKKANDLAEQVREYIEAPEGELISEYDASGQESRIMGMWSQDPTMIDIFQNKKNFHSMTAAGVIGMPYEQFQRMVDAEDAQATEYRQMGKLANLSCNFRIGGPALSKQTFVKYDMVLSIPVANQLVNTFKRLYRGVPSYWDRAIDFSRGSGYATTAADRRYKLNDWSKSWGPEQTAISHPIQGTGAEHKLIALATVSKKIPEARFFMDLHDASFFLVPSKECHEEVGHVLNSIEYEPIWCNVTCNVPLPFEGKFGTSFKDVK
jgi:DNA polymerase I-like protein with 3'-5' exonuclease and polymerase domains